MKKHGDFIRYLNVSYFLSIIKLILLCLIFMVGLALLVDGMMLLKNII